MFGSMKLRRVVQKAVPIKRTGAHGLANLNAAVVANVSEPGTRRTRASARQRIVQRGDSIEVTGAQDVRGDG